MNVKNLRREIAEYILAFFIVLVFVFMLVSLAAVLDDPKKVFKSSEAASWVQAIGSIAAIFGAFMFGERQAKHALETAQVIQDREILRRNEAFLSIS
jgi:Mn2+/Fe2+ NRAMP family transporter